MYKHRDPNINRQIGNKDNGYHYNYHLKYDKILLFWQKNLGIIIIERYQHTTRAHW